MSTLNLTISTTDLPLVLEGYIKQATNVLLTSSPGVGKTAIVKATCENLGYKLLTIHGVTCDPVDLSGLPFVSKDGKTADYLPAGTLAKIVKATEPTVVFLDDIGQAPPAVQAAIMQLVWDRLIGEHRVPDCVTFVMASNRRKDKAGVSGMLSTLLDRAVHLEVSPDYKAWINWAVSQGFDDKVITYIQKTRGEALYDFKPSTDFTKSATARGWEMVNRTLTIKPSLPAKLRFPALAGCIGEGQAVAFEAHLRVYEDLPSFEDILNDPDSVEVPSGESSGHILYALSGVLARCILDGDKRFENAWRWAERVCEAGHVEQAAYMMHFVHHVDSTRCIGEAFIRLSANHLSEVLA